MDLILGYLFGILTVFPAYCLVVKQRDQLDNELLKILKICEQEFNLKGGYNNDNK